jgi:hypothetical protein
MKLVWKKEPAESGDHSHVGRVATGEPMALFIISRSAGGFALSGAFVPDGEDGREYRRLAHAKEAAQGWMNQWVRQMTKGWREAGPMPAGDVTVPVSESNFGDYLNLRGLIPDEADAVMVMLNAGGGLNAGFPQPVGFLRLPHQLYVRDLETLLKEQAGQHGHGTLWVTVAPVRSGEYLDVWRAKGVSSPKLEPEGEGD